jgi:tRNA threonylcarbamoyladenosine biosynthesis protein TsaB
MNLLAVDTSSTISAIGLQIGEERWQSLARAARSHSRDILPNIVELLGMAGAQLKDLDAIVFGKGPGSFTGLRITAGVVQGLGFGLQIPVVSVSTLACLAQGEYRKSGATNIFVVLSARKEEVYFGAYHMEDAQPCLIGREGVIEASLVPVLQPGVWAGVGDGWHLRGQLEKAACTTMQHIQVQAHPRPYDLLDIGVYKMSRGQSMDAMQALPEYLREQVTGKPR